MATDADQATLGQPPPSPAPNAAASPPSPPPDIDLDPSEYERDDRVNAEQMAEYLASKKPAAPKTPEASVTPPDVPAPAPASPQHDPRWVAMARGIGFSDARLASIPPDRLPDIVQAVFEQRQEWEKNQAKPQPPAPATPAPEPEFAIPGLDESKWDPELVAPIKKVLADQAKRQKELDERIAALNKMTEQQRTAQLERELDAFYATNEKVYGKGDLNTTSRTQPSWMRRLQVAGLVLNQGYTPAQAHAAVFGDLDGSPAPSTPPPAATRPPAPPPAPVAPGPTPQEVAAELSKRWNDAGLQPPTQRTRELPKGRDKAIASVSAILESQKNGTTESLHGSGDEENDFV